MPPSTTPTLTTYLSRPLHPHPVAHAPAAPAPAPAPAQVPRPEPLKGGEVLYWHHLLRSGEIPAVEEDARARLDDGDGDGDEEVRYAVPSGIVAGR